ncbi:MAG TPA: type II toxin-antitoxin system VapC family toxin [Solirubrobacterales bacterium]|nr:type II toxin-antitoxin system VapC family toxin [Solirubrobacterales bacterium]
MIVLDASALLDLLLATDPAERILGHVANPEVPIVAPDHMLVETTRVLRRLAIAGVISDERADREAANALGLDVTVYPSQDLLPRAWRYRDRITIDDALYLVLTEVIAGASLLTTDRKLARAASGRVPVIPL